MKDMDAYYNSMKTSINSINNDVKEKQPSIIKTFFILCVLGLLVWGIIKTIDFGKKKTDETVLTNVWITSAKDSEVNLVDNNKNKSYTTSALLSKDLSEVIGDVTLKDGIISKVSIKTDTITGKLLSATNEYVEIEDYGKIFLTDDCKTYSFSGSSSLPEEISLIDISVGEENISYVLSGDKICAVLLKGDTKKASENIRVVIMNNNYGSIYHDNVILQGSDNIIITKEDGNQQKVEKGKAYNIGETAKLKNGEKITITPQSDSGKIKLNSVKRGAGNIFYNGKIEVYSEKSGYVIVNELDVEEYLCGVVPSEMPKSFGLEALKAQAVCARTYAYQHIESTNYEKYNANVDDSTSYQVYNNQVHNDTADKAVSQTKSKVMKANGELIDAFYFSTSCGYISPVKEVFATTSDISYLQGGFQSEKANELSFEMFIKNNHTECFEDDCEWFRWKTTIAGTDLSKSVNSAIKKLTSKSSENVLVLDNKKYVSKKIDSIGNIKSISISNRTESGLANEIIIKGAEKTVKVKSQNIIRTVLAPIYDDVIKKDGSKVSKMKLLPSAYIVIEQKDKNFNIYGGGYGHGTGMSQYGAKKLAETGSDYTEILEHYYSGITIL